MKKQTFIKALILFLFCVLSFSACKKEEKDPPPIIVSDTTPPIISLIGGLNINHPLNTIFTDSGATAMDNHDGDLTGSISVTGTVNKDLKGTYVLTYIVADAAGNTASIERTVNVVNSAEFYAGSYSVTDLVSGNTMIYVDAIYVSSTVNNRIWVSKFADYMNASVYFNINGSTVTIPSQTVNCGNPAANRQFTGSGTISGTTITLNYAELTNGTTSNGVETYIKQ